MGEISTHSTDSSVDDLIAGVADDARRADCLTLLEVMARATAERPLVLRRG